MTTEFVPKTGKGTGYEWEDEEGITRSVELFEGEQGDTLVFFKIGGQITPIRMSAVATVLLAKLLHDHVEANIDKAYEVVEWLKSSQTKG